MTKNKMNILNGVFTRTALRHLIENNRDKTYSAVVKRYVENPEFKKNVDLISEIYSELRDGYRNEYFYKNTLLNKLLLGVHSVNTTTALTEIPIAKSKADFLLINGKAVVYEIKTELDNFERLETQINDYYRAFDHVAVVTSKLNLPILEKKLQAIDKPVGIYVLTKKGSLHTERKPQKYEKDLDSEILFKLLRKPEYESIILGRFGELPSVNQFEYYKQCKSMFLEIPINEAYLLVLKQLKKRAQIVKEEFINVPYELKFLAYFMELKKDDYQNLNEFLQQRYGGA